jgi:Fur family transcriptional regulator, ferric uptake regulator
MTKAREAALDILFEADEPLTAAAVFQQIGDFCDLATVYRSLHYLEKNGFAESFVLFCEQHGAERYYTALAESGESGEEKPASHRHWFHCEGCHRFIEIGSCTVSALTRQFESEQNLTVRRHILYFIGLCSECRGEKAGPGKRLSAGSGSGL